MTLREKVLNLRSQDQSYSKIAKALNVPRSTVAYHLSNSKSKITSLLRQIRWKKENALSIKITAFKYRRRSHPKIKNDPGLTVKNLKKKFGKNPKCYLTNTPVDLNNSRDYSLDHIVPISKGGTNSLRNCGLASIKANQLKSDLSYKGLLKMCRLIIKNKKNNLKLIE